MKHKAYNLLFTSLNHQRVTLEAQSDLINEQHDIIDNVLKVLQEARLVLDSQNVTIGVLVERNETLTDKIVMLALHLAGQREEEEEQHGSDAGVRSDRLA